MVLLSTFIPCCVCVEIIILPSAAEVTLDKTDLSSAPIRSTCYWWKIIHQYRQSWMFITIQVKQATRMTTTVFNFNHTTIHPQYSVALAHLRRKCCCSYQQHWPSQQNLISMLKYDWVCQWHMNRVWSVWTERSSMIIDQYDQVLSVRSTMISMIEHDQYD